ncbi:MAG: hypothetical protein HYV60_02220 [Planctomycetia bacterium]|nr:hypothetical protein [Planctomycetia bacterium]
MPVPLALLSVLGIGLSLGLVHGLLVTRLKLQPFVVTLCGLLIYRGVSRWLVNDQPVGFGNEYNGTLSSLGSGKLVLWQWETAGHAETFGVPYPFFILLAGALVAGIFLRHQHRARDDDCVCYLHRGRGDRRHAVRSRFQFRIAIQFWQLL